MKEWLVSLIDLVYLYNSTKLKKISFIKAEDWFLFFKQQKQNKTM